MYDVLLNNAFLLYLLSAALFFLMHACNAEKLRRFAVGLLLLGGANNGAAILLRWRQLHYPPLSNMHETLVLFSFFLAAAYLLLARSVPARGAGGAAAFFCLVSLGYASALDRSLRPLMPALKSNWLVIHVASYFIGYSVCFTAFVAGLAYLVRAMRKTGDRKFLETLDRLNFRAVRIAFPMLTLGLTTGAVWANLAWGRYWGWDPKETWALITWLIYVLYIHVRPVAKDPRRSSAALSVLGFLAILVTFVGAGMYFPGMHSYR